MTKLVNLTPHAITLVESTSQITITASGQIARLSVTREQRDPLLVRNCAISVSKPTLGEITGLPDPEPGTIFIVSALVADAAKRADVMSPGELLRDPDGVIVGAHGLCSYV